ncbi:hypothetical protein [Streptosporangium sp. NPDC000509]
MGEVEQRLVIGTPSHRAAAETGEPVADDALDGAVIHVALTGGTFSMT